MIEGFNLKEDILNITEMRKNLPQILDEVAEEHTYKVVLRHGKPAVVMLNIDEFQEMQDRLLAMELEMGLREALEEHKRGELVSVDELIDEMAVEYGVDLSKLPPKPKGYDEMIPKPKIKRAKRAS